MLLHSLRAPCRAPAGAGSIWKYLEALARATGVSGRFVYGFRTDLHFADGRFPSSVAIVACLLIAVSRWIDWVSFNHPGGLEMLFWGQLDDSISNNPSFLQKHLGDPDGSDGSD